MQGFSPSTKDGKGENVEEITLLKKAVNKLFECLADDEEEEGNFIKTVNDILEWSVKEDNDNYTTGVEIFKDLLSTTSSKRHRKQLRQKMDKIMILLLKKSSSNINAYIVCIEVVAQLVAMGNGLFHRNDFSLVFQALTSEVKESRIQDFCRIFTAKFTILSWSLFFYSENVYGLIHIFIPCVRELLESLLRNSCRDISSDPLCPTEETDLLNCSNKMARLYQEISSHKDVMSKYSLYLLADCIHVISCHGARAPIRQVIVQGVYYIFDLCNDDCLTKLHVYLPNNQRELFRSLKEDYTAHHKFKGNA
ncbi:unhealthy ribosome biogenesis protein 2 homolog [Xenia sp. Carnegie-2017]|uniref:unhealthy ribosome biogenesis protein 2 homolog n=1 Tax=Xenia sp. Carnegie-2017 TaxID=2897299 RepID=UPI001F038BF2|nr:unhealthy ribosome biogenesis protein 2 homolog [Xenia sp. Carnegie-2017]